MLGNPVVAYGAKFVIVSGALGEGADQHQQRDKTATTIAAVPCPEHFWNFP
jgi:hypothetical protein